MTTEMKRRTWVGERAARWSSLYNRTDLTPPTKRRLHHDCKDRPRNRDFVFRSVRRDDDVQSLGHRRAWFAVDQSGGKDRGSLLRRSAILVAGRVADLSVCKRQIQYPSHPKISVASQVNVGQLQLAIHCQFSPGLPFENLRQQFSIIDEVGVANKQLTCVGTFFLIVGCHVFDRCRDDQLDRPVMADQGRAGVLW